MAKLTGVAVASFTLALAAGVLLGTCGSDSNSDDIKGLCTQGCAKTKECLGSLGASLNCTEQCNKPETTSTSTCTNSAAQIAKSKECLGKSACDEFLPCAQGIPACVRPAGGAGGAGAGGSGAGGAGAGGAGAGGAGGATSEGCGDCAKADTCIAKLGVDAGVGTAGGYAAICASATGAQRAQLVMACQAVVTTAAALCQ
jgi:hypothetical protein